MFKKICLAAALVALPAQMTLAAPKRCLTDKELNAGVTYFLPVLVQGVQQSCSSLLPKTSYFATKGPALVQQYTTYKSAMNPDVASLLDLLGTEMKLPASAKQPAADLAAAIIVDEIGKAMKPEICAPVDKAFALLEPLPPANMGGLIELFVHTMDEGDAGKAAKAGSPYQPILCSTKNAGGK